ncbi:sugar kinase [Vibrio natriegens]|uniref:sugar kinase n=1 Tax=Vibrio natriegens TaxID=691 RepID=UPI00080459E1|nr:sugar kinase [Vibrio natriegens]ANQ16945.1 ketodeoxygluconokinase [Vibrio natriegens]
MKHIAIIGECMIELNGKPFGPMQQTYGGDTLNAAVYLCRGREANLHPEKIKVSYVTALGTDPLSEGMLNRWEQEGIDTSFTLRDHHRSPGLYLIQLDDQGERTFLYWRNQSAARYIMQHPQIADIESALTKVDMVFVSGISLAILPEEDRVELLSLLSELRQNGVEIAFDSNFRQALWPNDNNATVKFIYETMYQLTDLALVTFDDEQQLWGDATPARTLNRLLSLGVRRCVVKTGPDGCLVQETEKEARIVTTTPVEQVVDTTSAGDSFNGGFLSAYLDGNGLVESCHRGNQLAGTVIQHRGAIIDKIYTQSALKAQ